MKKKQKKKKTKQTPRDNPSNKSRRNIYISRREKQSVNGGIYLYGVALKRSVYRYIYLQVSEAKGESERAEKDSVINCDERALREGGGKDSPV